jgi:predicted CXXCH cytochrome family protein
MLTAFRISALCYLLVAGVAAQAQPVPEYSADGAKLCLSCHDFGPESPVHNVLAGSHGDMEAGHGCENCHGPSAAHTRAPTKTSPGVSFGPRWTATSADQDTPCLACHEDNVARHWRDALHMINNLTCVTCHDIHAEQDKVLVAKQQAEVCTVCHKAQKQGIHGMQRRASRNPPCTECHNPHRQETARDEMLQNHSAGCSTCHDLVRMAARDSVSDKAKSYHKVMATPGSTCLQCHEGVAHAPADSVPPMQPTPRASRAVTLFYPGIADSDWLLQSHKGSQPLRQGTNCQRCHRGDEAAMGESRGGRFDPVSRNVQLTFKREGDQLHIAVEWQGPENDATVSFMWGTEESESFSRGGCFAACHSDMPGMTKDRGQQTSKYLMVSRSQQQQIGRPPIIKNSAELEQLMSQQAFVEIWRIPLHSPTVERALVLADTKWQATDLIQINKSYSDGRWRLELRRKMQDTGMMLGFDTNKRYTFGLALNGADNHGGNHWVSLPITLSFGGNNSDFTAE